MARHKRRGILIEREKERPCAVIKESIVVVKEGCWNTEEVKNKVCLVFLSA